MDHISTNLYSQPAHERLRQLQEIHRSYERLFSTLTRFPHRISYIGLLPYGPRAYFPGKIIHTNEITVLIGENYFVEKSTFQAIEIIKRRMDVLQRQMSEMQVDEASFRVSTKDLHPFEKIDHGKDSLQITFNNITQKRSSSVVDSSKIDTSPEKIVDQSIAQKGRKLATLVDKSINLAEQIRQNEGMIMLTEEYLHGEDRKEVPVRVHGIPQNVEFDEDASSSDYEDLNLGDDSDTNREPENLTREQMFEYLMKLEQEEEDERTEKTRVFQKAKQVVESFGSGFKKGFLSSSTPNSRSEKNLTCNGNESKKPSKKVTFENLVSKDKTRQIATSETSSNKSDPNEIFSGKTRRGHFEIREHGIPDSLPPANNSRPHFETGGATSNTSKSEGRHHCAEDVTKTIIEIPYRDDPFNTAGFQNETEERTEQPKRVSKFKQQKLDSSISK